MKALVVLEVEVPSLDPLYEFVNDDAALTLGADYVHDTGYAGGAISVDAKIITWGVEP